MQEYFPAAKWNEEAADDTVASMKRAWRVKLIFTNLKVDGLTKILARNVGKMFDWKYGMVHAALQVGPMLLEWDSSSLCVPLDMESFFRDDTLIAIDLECLENPFLQQEAVHKVLILTGHLSDSVQVTEVIAEYNRNRNYDVLHCNCQHFVDDVLRAIGIAPKFTGVLQTFLQQLQTAEPGNFWQALA